MIRGRSQRVVDVRVRPDPSGVVDLVLGRRRARAQSRERSIPGRAVSRRSRAETCCSTARRSCTRSTLWRNNAPAPVSLFVRANPLRSSSRRCALGVRPEGAERGASGLSPRRVGHERALRLGESSGGSRHGSARNCDDARRRRAPTCCAKHRRQSRHRRRRRVETLPPVPRARQQPERDDHLPLRAPGKLRRLLGIARRLDFDHQGLHVRPHRSQRFGEVDAVAPHGRHPSTDLGRGANPGSASPRCSSSAPASTPSCPVAENIYLNGSILGSPAARSTAVLGEIIEFSGLEDFVDSPVKHYSERHVRALGLRDRGGT